MRNKILALLGGALAALMLFASTALAVNLSYPATYKGTTAAGGLVELDTSPDGHLVTRVVVSQVPTSCGTFSGATTTPIPLTAEAFSVTLTGGSGLSMNFQGSFPSHLQALGSMSGSSPYYPYYPPYPYFPCGCYGCSVAPIAWSASAPLPNTSVTSGPDRVTWIRTASFRFASTESNSTFRCRLDEGRWRSCGESQVYRHLSYRKHALKVVATDAAGNVDPKPAEYQWWIKRSCPCPHLGHHR